MVGTEVVQGGKSPPWPVGFGESFMEEAGFELGFEGQVMLCGCWEGSA